MQHVLKAVAAMAATLILCEPNRRSMLSPRSPDVTTLGRTNSGINKRRTPTRALLWFFIGSQVLMKANQGELHENINDLFDRRQLVLPVTSTIFAGRYGVIIRYGGTVDYRPTNQAIEAETYGRQDTGNGSGQGWDERAFSAQVAEWPIAVAGETGSRVPGGGVKESV